MSIVVEDGTGLLTAESYLSLVGFGRYWDARNPDFDYSGFSDEQIEGALRRATSYLDGRYRGRWPGNTVKGRAQALAWPRTGSLTPSNTPFTFLISKFAQDADGNDIDNVSVPREIAAACAELAAREVIEPGVLSPDKVSQRTLSVSVTGAVSETYERMGDQRPVVVIVNELLAALIGGLSNTVLLMRG
jgi:hypothetical protein